MGSLRKFLHHKGINFKREDFQNIDTCPICSNDQIMNGDIPPIFAKHIAEHLLHPVNTKMKY